MQLADIPPPQSATLINQSINQSVNQSINQSVKVYFRHEAHMTVLIRAELLLYLVYTNFSRQNTLNNVMCKIGIDKLNEHF